MFIVKDRVEQEFEYLTQITEVTGFVDSESQLALGTVN